MPRPTKGHGSTEVILTTKNSIVIWTSEHRDQHALKFDFNQMTAFVPLSLKDLKELSAGLLDHFKLVATDPYKRKWKRMSISDLLTHLSRFSPAELEGFHAEYSRFRETCSSFRQSLGEAVREHVQIQDS